LTSFRGGSHLYEPVEAKEDTMEKEAEKAPHEFLKRRLRSNRSALSVRITSSQRMGISAIDPGKLEGGVPS